MQEIQRHGNKLITQTLYMSYLPSNLHCIYMIMAMI